MFFRSNTMRTIGRVQSRLHVDGQQHRCLNNLDDPDLRRQYFYSLKSGGDSVATVGDRKFWSRKLLAWYRQDHGSVLPVHQISTAFPVLVGELPVAVSPLRLRAPCR
ncbi:hypothetical protein MTO96_031706 [Rhipicephalus appendiculatus]